MKNIIAFVFMIAFLNQELKPRFFHVISRLLPISIGLVLQTPLTALGNTVEITLRSIKENQVTLRVKVVNQERVPIQGLKTEDFQIETTDKQGQPITLNPSQIKLISSKQTKPDPAYLIVLLDMSGSMKNKDSAQEVKLKGAIDGLKDFLAQIEKENLRVQISLVPFAEKGGKCTINYQVTPSIIQKNFDSAPYSKTKNKLEELARVDVCGATNIYQPLSEAIRYLGIEDNLQSIPTNETDEQPSVPPRLGVILFSDGFDVYRSNEPQRFQNLQELMNQSPEVSVHTMGYGERLYQLRDRTKCPLSDSQLTVDNVRQVCKLYNNYQENIIKEFIVDEPRLKEIADQTGGISLFPGNPKEVIDSLRQFLTTLREYEIQFQQPGADRASQHKTMVKLDSSSRGLQGLASNEVKYRMNNFVDDFLPLQQRLGIGVATILLGFGGFLLFSKWSKDLDQQSQTFLSD